MPLPAPRPSAGRAALGVALSLAANVALTAPVAPSEEDLPSLAAVFGDRFRFGFALKELPRLSPPERAIVVRHANTLTPENAGKWERVQPREGEWNFGPLDELVAFGEAHGMFVVGHTLVWHSQCPDWVFDDGAGGLVTRDQLIERMRTHIHTVVRRYRGRIHAWDVVNEAVTAEGPRRSKWHEVLGEDYIPLAFAFAHEADPDALLLYNDYSVFDSRKRAHIIALVRDLQRRGLRIDAVGMQGHWHLDYPSLEAIENAILDLHRTGVQVHITELDIDVLPAAWDYFGADIATRFEGSAALNPYTEGLPLELAERLADRYETIFRLFLRHADKVDRVTLWGVWDGRSWKNNFPVRGRTNHPLLFDRDLRPKEAAWRLANLAAAREPGGAATGSLGR